MDEMKEILQNLVDKFNSKDDPRKEKIKNLERTIVIKFTDDGTYYFKLKDAKLSDVEEGDIKGDIIVETTSETFNNILNKKEDAISAYFSKKIKTFPWD
jgi:putative sterol carrier protein